MSDAKNMPTPLSVETDADGRFILNGHNVVWHSTYVRVVKERDALTAALEEITELLFELNVSNYTHDDVCELNGRVVEAVLAARAALSLTKDKP